MPPRPKRSRQNKSRARAGKKRHVLDRHRWRKVAATLLSILFFVPFTLSFYVHGRWFVWCVVASIVLLLCLACILLEWHVWKRKYTLRRLALLLICTLLITAGFKWQSKIRVASPRHPWLRFTDEEMHEFVATLASQKEQRDRVRLGCPAGHEDICVLAAPFMDAFKRGHFLVEGDQIYRVTLGKPTAGVIISSYGHADAFDPQDPDQGKWVRQTPSLDTIEEAFGTIGINAAGGADESLPNDVITIYFGIEPDERTDKQRESLRKQRRQAQEEFHRQQTP